MMSFNRPLLLNATIEAMYKNPGAKFNLIMWDNGSDKETQDLELKLQKKYKFLLYVNKENIGHQAIYQLFQMVGTEYTVFAEDDFLYFSDNWLGELESSMEQKFKVISPKPFKERFGIVAANCVCDKVCNGALWKECFKSMQEYGKYLAKVIAAGLFILRTIEAHEMNAVTMIPEKFGNVIDIILEIYNRNYYFNAYLKDTYIYHANSPYWNIYAKEWSEKQSYSIKKGYSIWKRKANFDFTDPEPMDRFLKGDFDKYCLERVSNYKDIYSFQYNSKIKKQF